MAPGVHLVLALLLLPTLILSEPIHVPITYRRRTKLTRDWTHEANIIRKRYGYQLATSRRSKIRAVAGIPILDQVNIVIVFHLYHQLITRIGWRF